MSGAIISISFTSFLRPEVARWGGGGWVGRLRCRKPRAVAAACLLLLFCCTLLPVSHGCATA